MPPKIRSVTVPWMNPEQLNKVYSCLYSNSLSEKRWAVDQISVWNTRCHPSLPTAVESTVSLVRATIHDVLYQADKTFCQEEDIQMLYSMALIRFVNLTLEHHQKGPNKLGMSFLASKLNIPSWVVDLRNEATHSFCPSLSMLRMGADIALNYLEKTFWLHEVASAKAKTNLPCGREKEITNLIDQYKCLQFQRAENSEKYGNSKLEKSLRNDVKDVLKKMGRFLFHSREKFLDVLVHPENFISVKDMKKLNVIASPLITDKSNLVLPHKLQVFWNPLLRKIHFKDLLPMFLEKLLLAQDKCRIKICQKTAVAWTLNILMGVSTTSSLSECFRAKGLLLNLCSLLYACMKTVTPHSTELLMAILSKLKKKDQYDFLFLMMSLYQGHFLDREKIAAKRKRNPDEEIVFTLEDAEEELKKKKMRTQGEENIWFSPSGTKDFSNDPIGAILIPVSQDKNSLEEEQKKIEPPVDEIFIILNKNDGEGTVEEEITHDKNTFPVTTRPENFDMIYRRRPKQA